MGKKVPQSTRWWQHTSMKPAESSKSPLDTIMQSVKVVVVGAGVVGLSTAVCIAETLPHCSVTVISERFTPDTTSDGAAGILFASQFPDIPLERQQRWFKDSFDHLLAIAQSSESGDTGVILSSGCQVFKEVPADKRPFWAEHVLGFRVLSDREMKRFPDHRFGQAFTTIKCECITYLPWLEKRFGKAGGKILYGKVSDLQRLADTYDVIVNCSGLGAHSLVGDTKMYPIRGQILKFQAPWVKNFIRDGDGHTYVYPGVNSLTLGGTRQAGDWRLKADVGDREGILERCFRLEPALHGGQVVGEWVGLRPGRESPRVEVERLRTAGGREVPLVHNYGHGGWGVTLAWGTALDALGLVRQSLLQHPPRARL
ncbi:D-aspartate oxidase-like isoform X1 [Sardina pilchardus]|uniref:D-aspartate oxidase-like isoform X1 n=2 Tax=Sardina pilchardus TaxID=27697 RepID=UPI002E0EE868